jgi:hypothetical protein
MAGCEPEVSKPATAPMPDLTAATVSNNGLALTVDLDQTTFISGQQFTVKIGVVNSSDKPLVIDAGYAAPYVISIQQKITKGWEVVNRYPQVTQGLMRAWTLPAGKSADFQPILIVEPSWPSHEPLRLEVKLNGRDDVAPFVTIMVVSKEV